MSIEAVAFAPENAKTLKTRSAPRHMRRGVNHIGAKARWAYQEYGLYCSARYPPYKLAFHSPFQQAFVILVAAYLTWVAGREVKKSTGKSLFAQFREMISLWFGQRVDPPSYYAQELFRQTQMSRTSQFLTRFETKNGILQLINNLRTSPFETDEMSDKALFARCCATHGIPHVQTLAVLEQDQVLWNIDPQQLRHDVFFKRKHGKGAIGAEAFRHVAPDQFLDCFGQVYGMEHLINHVQQGAKGKSMLLQRWLQNHSDISDLARDSLIAFRVITCVNEHNEFEVTDAMLRILVDLEPRWKPASADGEFAAPIDLATGRLGFLTGDNMRTCCRRYETHPITNAKVKDRIVQQWPAIAAMVTACHAIFPHRLMIGWDIALTPDGPVVLEGNTKFDVMFLQRVQDRPAGETRLGQLLALHLRELAPQKTHRLQNPEVAKLERARVANAAAADAVA
jgi:Sugar-transfer associated ATP-grasp